FTPGGGPGSPAPRRKSVATPRRAASSIASVRGDDPAAQAPRLAGTSRLTRPGTARKTAGPWSADMPGMGQPRRSLLRRRDRRGFKPNRAGDHLEGGHLHQVADCFRGPRPGNLVGFLSPGFILKQGEGELLIVP